MSIVRDRNLQAVAGLRRNAEMHRAVLHDNVAVLVIGGVALWKLPQGAYQRQAEKWQYRQAPSRIV